MCVEGWKRKNWNPAGIPVKTIEVSFSFAIVTVRSGASMTDGSGFSFLIYQKP